MAFADEAQAVPQGGRRSSAHVAQDRRRHEQQRRHQRIEGLDHHLRLHLMHPQHEVGHPLRLPRRHEHQPHAMPRREHHRRHDAQPIRIDMRHHTPPRFRFARNHLHAPVATGRGVDASAS